MTAIELIDSIFSRPQRGVAGEVRRITDPQLKYLCDLVEGDKEKSAVRAGRGRSFVWSPEGAYQYVVTENIVSEKHTLMRVLKVIPEDTADLFSSSSSAQ